MDRNEWMRQLMQLQRGELELSPPEEPNRLSAFSSGWLGDMKTYVQALEHGYRALTEALRPYRGKEKAAETIGLKAMQEEHRAQRELIQQQTDQIAELEACQWSDGACLGYALMGLRGAGIPPADAVRVLEAIEEAMELYELNEAAELHQQSVEDRVGDPDGEDEA